MHTTRQCEEVRTQAEISTGVQVNILLNIERPIHRAILRSPLASIYQGSTVIHTTNEGDRGWQEELERETSGSREPPFQTTSNTCYL